MIIKPVYLVKIKVFNIANTLNILKENNINISNLTKIDEYTYSFYVSIYKIKLLNKTLLNYKIIKQEGLLSNLLHLLKYKTTLIAMIISILSYTELSNRIWNINVTGDNNNLNQLVINKLNEKGIYIGAKKKNVNEISSIQNEILYSIYDEVEYLSIKTSGCLINVTFKQKRIENDKIEFKKSLYAKKDGMIKSFDILSGNKVVSINDYVKKGDLLVEDVLTNDYNEQIYIGTYGSVYAYTWYYTTMNFKVDILDSNETILANALLLAKNKICASFTNKEYIYEENMLQFNRKDNNVYIKLHFTCVEDIAVEV